MEIIEHKRFLVRSLFDGERICQLRLVDLTGTRLTVSPFVTETPATVFIDARVVLLDRRLLIAGNDDVTMENENIAAGCAGLEQRLSSLASGNIEAADLVQYIARSGQTLSASVIAVAY